MTRLTKAKQNIRKHKDKLCNPKIQRQTQGPTGLYDLFLLTVPIEEVARWQYNKTVQIIFPLKLQTITLTLDVVKWSGRRRQYSAP